MIEAKKIIKSGQEQAVASWINYLNQVRLDRLMAALQKEESNLNEAMSTINDTLKTISRDIVNNGKDEAVNMECTDLLLKLQNVVLEMPENR